MKTVRVVLIEEVGIKYNSLRERASGSKKESAIVEAIKDKAELIKKDMHYGIPVNKKLIPDVYRTNYDVKNLFRVELAYFWRMLYTLKNDHDDGKSYSCSCLGYS
ncbi:hypothetical protein SAMN04488589_0124 [Methanolobus vulcani]|uniref:Uncharacterized protein n=1 Tax=Methanolobus vulcani TaxID=38026 RepID=A0A7Z7AXA6_9EURY|nr:hypothetical protein [Methanolobus vulcani]MDK2826989.1 hypothetical protein [Methanolobus sp.]SDF25239.1 hypothetical protein SAMN04488589_0124 [Methanolobus vulcani]